MSYTCKIVCEPTEKEVKTITDFMYEEWFHYTSTYEQTFNFISEMFTMGIPCTAILYNDTNDIIGCGSVADLSNTPRRDLTPWLADIYIIPEYRGKHLLKIIIDTLEKHVKQNVNAEKLYVQTQFEGLYEKFGYTFLDYTEQRFICENESNIQRIYYKEL